MSVYIVKRKNRTRKTTYHVRWSKGKYEPYVYLGVLDTKARAEMRKNKVLDLLALGIEPTLAMFKHTTGGEVKRLGAAVEDYLRAQSHWNDRTRLVRTSIAHGIVAYFGEKIVPARITVEDVQRWINHMQDAGLQPTTMKTRLAVLNRIMQFVKHPDNPVRSADLNKPRGRARRKDLPRASEVAAVRSELKDDRAVAIFDILEHGGLRLSEAIELLGTQVDEAGGRLVNVGTKTETQRIVECLPGQPDWIPAASGSGRVFDVTATWFQYQLRAANERAGTTINPHLLRHLHASRLLQGDKPGGLPTTLGPADMAARMGHTIKQFQETYTHRIAPAS